MAMSKSSPRRYTVSKREEAVQLAGELGLIAAAAHLGIPVTTVAEWRRKHRSTEKTRGDATESSRETGSEHRINARKVATRHEPYSAAQREQAVLRASEVGQSAAARELEIPLRTVARWHREARRLSSPSSSVANVESASTSAAGPMEPREPAKVAKTYTPSQRAQVLEFAAREGATAAAIHFGVSRFSIYEWQRRTRLHAEGKAADSPVVGPDDDRAASRDHRILSEWKAHPGLGPSQVRNQLRRQGFKVSVHTVRCVLEENGYVTPKIRRQIVHDQCYEAVRPNHMWHLDFLHRYVNKQKVYVLLIIDDFSRFIVGGALWNGERVAAVQETFLAAVNRYGRPEKAMSDGGSAFYSWNGVGSFTRLLDELEVDQLIAEVPEVNGKLEVLNANIQKELFNKEQFFDLGEAQRRLVTWIDFYNLRRTHHALGGLQVPGDRYFGRADEVLAYVEAGRSPDGVGEPLAPGERQLDLFRITSQRGRVEVYLLGQRILTREVQQ